MKKFVALLVAVLMMVAVFALPMAASDGDGITFGDNAKFQTKKALEEIPLSFEAWVSLPKDAGRAGVIIGNYSGSPASFNFEITTNGRPRLYIVEYSTGEKTIHDLTFSADARMGDYAHVAIVYDPVAEITTCYVNGENKGTKSGALNLGDEIIKNAFVIGGDLRSGNAQYFKGAIESVAVYSDTRTQAEIKASMNGVDTADSNLLAYYRASDLKGAYLSDASGNGYDFVRVEKWLDSKEPVSDYAYSFCVVGDTQVITEKHPDKLASIYDWIIANKEEKKIEFVFGMGDITNKNTDEEWVVAKEQIFKLNDVVPYSIVRGNHDGSDNLNKYFAKLDYMAEFDGFYDKYKIDNSWRTFSVGETDYLLITLDFGPSDVLLEWAADLIESHPEHKVIITTHCYLYRDGTTLDAGDVAPPNKSGANDGARNNGDQMWDKLVSKYENIFLVLSGHDPSENVVATQSVGDHGNVVTQILVDPQGVDSAEGATGMVAMLYFSNDGKTLTVEQYSTVHDKYYMNTSQFTLPLPADFAVEETEPAETEAFETFLPETEYAPDTNNNGGADIGIIGGADGPTAIFVAGSLLPLIVVGAVVMLAAGVVIGIIVGRKCKK